MKDYINKATTILLMLSCMISLVFLNTENSSATTIIIESCLSEVVPDEHGGAFVVICDSDNDKIMIQHLDSTGNFLWEGSGTIMPYTTSSHKSTYDGQGGVIHVWDGDINGIQGLYAKRIDNTGNSMWEGNGVLVHKREGGQWPGWLASFTTISDGDGGAIVTWQRLENPNPIYAQRIDSTGKITWGINGVLVAQNTYSYHDLSCISDGMGGAIVAWQEQQETGMKTFIQRLDNTGNLLWNIDGVQVNDEYSNYEMISDGNGGVIIVFDDYYDILFCHLNDIGEIMSGANNIKLDHTAFLYDLQILSDGFGGIFIVREEEYRGWNFLKDDTDLYAQRIDCMGNNLWTEKRIAICTNSSRQTDLSIVTDGSGGFIVAWQDYRNDSRYIFAQRVDTHGNALWTKDGINLGRYYYPYRDFEMVANGSGGTVIIREEGESLEPRIFSQVVDSNGVSDEPETSLYPPGFLRDRQDYEPLIGSTTTYYAPKRSIWVWLIPMTVFLVILVIFLLVRQNRRKQQI